MRRHVSCIVLPLALLSGLLTAGCGSGEAASGDIVVLSHYPNAAWVSPVVAAVAAVEGTTAATDDTGGTRAPMQVGGHTLSLVEYANHEAVLQRLQQRSRPPVAALLVVSGVEGLWQDQHGAQLRAAGEAGIPLAAVLLSQVQAVDDEELLRLIEELEIKDALAQAGYVGVPVVRGSAVEAVRGDARSRGSIEELVATLHQRVEPVLAAR